jgi:hypothetical protein
MLAVSSGLAQAQFWPQWALVYVPGAAGTILKLHKTDGSVVSRINPFQTLDPTIIVAGVLTADTAGKPAHRARQRCARRPDPRHRRLQGLELFRRQ